MDWVRTGFKKNPVRKIRRKSESWSGFLIDALQSLRFVEGSMGDWCGTVDGFTKGEGLFFQLAKRLSLAFDRGFQGGKGGRYFRLNFG